MIDYAALREALDRMIETDRALGAGDFDQLDPDAQDAMLESDGRARGHLLGLLRDLAGELDQDTAIIGPDGTVAARTSPGNELALVPPGRVVRLSEWARDPSNRDAIRAARMRRWRADCLRVGAEPLALVARRPDGSLEVRVSEDLPTIAAADLLWAASLLIADRAGRDAAQDGGAADELRRD